MKLKLFCLVLLISTLNACSESDSDEKFELEGFYRGNLYQVNQGSQLSIAPSDTSLTINKNGDSYSVSCDNIDFEHEFKILAFEDVEGIRLCLTGDDFEFVHGYQHGNNLQHHGSKHEPWNRHHQNQHHQEDDSYDGSFYPEYGNIDCLMVYEGVLYRFQGGQNREF